METPPNAVETFGAYATVVLGVGFWALLGAAIIWRVISAILRHRPGEIRTRVLAPFAASGAAQSEAFGWKPNEPKPNRPRNEPERE